MDNREAREPVAQRYDDSVRAVINCRSNATVCMTAGHNVWLQA